MHRVGDNGINIRTDQNEACLTASRSFKDEEVGNLNSTVQLSGTRPQRDMANTGDENQQETRQSSSNQGISGKNSQAHQTQGPAPRDQNQNVSTRPASQELIGVIPPREIDTRPPDSEADGTGNYRRMAVCQETDDALCQRTKMRVYMKRF
ncbi:hypothetical protein ACROYT_G007704 [Oculina patagonica]